MISSKALNLMSWCFILLGAGIVPLFGATKIITYEEDMTTAFDNPERGGRSGNTLRRIYMDLGSFSKTDVISQDWLNARRKEFQDALNQGKKIIPRFHYMFGCELQQDAPIERILKHMDQLAPLIRENSDLIVLMEAGFIGSWGEWHYAGCTDQYKVNTAENRKTILLKLLGILPKDRMVVVRYAKYKKEIFGTNVPLQPDSAFSGNDRARVGHQNDCFLKNIHDEGTYNTSTVEAEKDYLNLDNRYVPQEGETCGTDNNYAQCANALKDLKRMRWDFINMGFTSLWNSGGCLNEVLMKLGYRIVLRSAAFQDAVRPGNSFEGVINLQNVGWGKIFNPRGCELIFKNTTAPGKYTLKLDNDPRRWCMTDSLMAVKVSALIPAAMPEGTYSVYLNLPDLSPRLHDRKAYSIRLANKNVWEDSTGYNSLLHKVTISRTAPVIHRFEPRPFPGHGTVRSARHGTSVEFSVAAQNAAPVVCELFSLSGALIMRKAAAETDFGRYTVVWNHPQGSSSTCFVRFKSNGRILGSRLVRL
jgi:hypothetical protein